MHKHISLTAMLLLATSQACATFEIKDPANEIYEEKPASPISAAARLGIYAVTGQAAMRLCAAICIKLSITNDIPIFGRW